MTRRHHQDRIGVSVTLAFAKRSCLDKTRYASRNEARDKAARQKNHGLSAKEPYRCTLCDGWHLRTIKTEPERKRA